MARDLHRVKKTVAVPALEERERESRRNNLDRHNDGSLPENLSHTSTWRDNRVTEIRIPCCKLDNKISKGWHVERDIVSVLFVHRMVGEHYWYRILSSGSERRASE